MLSLLAMTLISGLVLPVLCARTPSKEKSPKVTAPHIVLVTFGSSYPAPHQTYRYIDELARARFDRDTISWAYTANFIIKKLREGRGEGALAGQKIIVDTPTKTVKSLIEAGHSTLVVQSLHLIPGEEFEELCAAMRALEQQYTGITIRVGQPLLNSDEDIQAVAEILAAQYEKAVAEGPVCFMGHGTSHPADDRYEKLELALQDIHPHFYVGTVEGRRFEAGESNIENLITRIGQLVPRPTSVTIAPLMSVVGDHAIHDMNAQTGASQAEDMSWREYLEAAGYTVHAVMKGLGDDAEINAIWMRHLEELLH